MPPTLYLDAASPVVTVGLRVDAVGAPLWHQVQDEAGVALFRAVDRLTRAHGIEIADIGRVVFCEGPGSLLGVRLAAMALRTWLALPRAAPLGVLGYRSLELVAAGLLAAGQGGPFHVITDGRRATWNSLRVDARGAFGPMARRAAAEAFPASEPVFHPQGFPLWQPLPSGARSVAYQPAALPDLATNFQLLRPIAAPEACMIEMPSYREWTHEHPTRPA